MISRRPPAALPVLALAAVCACGGARSGAAPPAPTPEVAPPPVEPLPVVEEAPEPESTSRVGYHISCSVSDTCRVQYIDESGTLRARDIVGEWSLEFHAEPNRRLWVRAGAGGCPPRPVRVEVRMGGAVVAEHLQQPPSGSRCQWILAETEFTIPG